MTQDQQLNSSNEKLAVKEEDNPVIFSSAPFPQMTPGVERYRYFKQKVEGPNNMKEEYTKVCVKVQHFNQLVEKLTVEFTTLSPAAAEHKKTQKKLALAQKSLEDFLKWKAILQDNSKILMNLTHMPFMLVERDNIYVRAKLMYLYTEHPYLNMTRLPCEEDRVYIRALQVEAEKLGVVPEMDFKEEMPKAKTNRPTKVFKSRK